ncbi:MAG TPA: YciC family protein [Candidatus Dormibacteraeota bacterium]|nr:YciC family protein [Candidatus Dormibacteraeota bacterium]
MDPDSSPIPPNAPTPETNPIPPPSPQPEETSPQSKTTSETFASQFNNSQAEDNRPDNKSLPSAFGLFKLGWEALKVNAQTLVLLGLFSIFLFFCVGLIGFIFSGPPSLSGHMNASHFGPILVSYAVAMLLFLGLFGPATAFTQIESAKQNKVGFKEALGKGTHLAFRFIGLSILVAIIVIIGLVLLFIPGVLMIKRYLMSPYLLVDKDLSVAEAMRQSAALSKQHSQGLWGLLGVQVLIGLPSIVPLIGSLVSLVLGIPYYCAPAVRYVQINQLTSASTQKATTGV